MFLNFSRAIKHGSEWTETMALNIANTLRGIDGFVSEKFYEIALNIAPKLRTAYTSYAEFLISINRPYDAQKVLDNMYQAETEVTQTWKERNGNYTWLPDFLYGQCLLM